MICVALTLMIESVSDVQHSHDTSTCDYYSHWIKSFSQIIIDVNVSVSVSCPMLSTLLIKGVSRVRHLSMSTCQCVSDVIDTSD